MKQIPMIEKYMTPMPHTVGPGISLKTAIQMMRDHHIRHLPVLNAGKLIGVITDRDIKLASAFQVNEDVLVDDVMTPEPYSTAPQTPIDQVVFEMAEHKYGCAVIQQENGKVVGIFTANDGLRVLGEILHTRYKAAQH
ncbi:MAG: CBS domain-containing protein [Oligoflexia bacterium]|nr:CBS domain-containing protein [Oligoflexia bacterium]